MRLGTTRRDFIKSGVAATAAVSVGIPVRDLMSLGSPEGGWLWDKGVCRFCNAPEAAEDEVVGARFNCTVCHVPPNRCPPLVGNRFAKED